MKEKDGRLRVERETSSSAGYTKDERDTEEQPEKQSSVNDAATIHFQKLPGTP